MGAALDLHETSLFVEGEGLVGSNPYVGVAPPAGEPEGVAEPELVHVHVAGRETGTYEAVTVRGISSVSGRGATAASTGQMQGPDGKVLWPEDFAEQGIEDDHDAAHDEPPFQK